MIKINKQKIICKYQQKNFAQMKIEEYYKSLPDKYKYSNGMPFNSHVKDTLDYILNFRVNRHFPSAIIIDGMSGQGKTTLAYHIAEYIQKHNVIADMQHGMGLSDFMTKVKHCIKNNVKCPIYDEAGDSDKRTFYSQLNRMLMRFFDLYRTFKILPIIVLPVFNRLEDGLFDKGIPRLLLHCHSRTKYDGNVSAYSLRRMLYLKKTMSNKEILYIQKAYSFNRPNIRFHFKNLPPKRSKELDTYSGQSKLKEFHELDILNRGLINIKEIADGLGRSVAWCRKHIHSLKIKETEIWKKSKYYEKKIMNRLEKEIKY